MALTLDADLGIVLTDEQAEQYPNETSRIIQLRSGIDHMYRFVRRVEVQLGLRARFPHLYQLEATELRDIPVQATLCAFEWYADSACDHCELVAEIGEKIAPNAADWQLYVQDVCDLARDLVAERHQSDKLRLTVGRRLVVYRPSNERPWSLTMFHEAIAARYGLRSG